jgi:hypothetical protein
MPYREYKFPVKSLNTAYIGRILRGGLLVISNAERHIVISTQCCSIEQEGRDYLEAKGGVSLNPLCFIYDIYNPIPKICIINIF